MFPSSHTHRNKQPNAGPLYTLPLSGSLPQYRYPRFMHLDPNSNVKYILLGLQLADPAQDLLIRHIADLRKTMRRAIARSSIEIDAITVLPAQLIMIWRTSHAPFPLAKIINHLKSDFAAQIVNGDQAQTIWARRNRVMPVTCQIELAHLRHMIHHAAVDAGLCTTPQEWLHSSIHRALAPALKLKDRRPECIKTQVDLAI